MPLNAQAIAADLRRANTPEHITARVIYAVSQANRWPCFNCGNARFDGAASVWCTRLKTEVRPRGRGYCRRFVEKK